ncbi:MAG: hypothetical protein U0166_25830 [Acidobacteriota bacterium]
MKPYQVVILAIVGFIPLGLAAYKRMQVHDYPTILGATYTLDKPKGDLHITVYGTMPDSCFDGSHAKVTYSENKEGGAITVDTAVKKSKLGGGGNCSPNAPYKAEGTLKEVPAGPYQLAIVGRQGHTLLRNISLPGTGSIPAGFTPEALKSATPK